MKQNGNLLLADAYVHSFSFDSTSILQPSDQETVELILSQKVTYRERDFNPI